MTKFRNPMATCTEEVSKPLSVLVIGSTGHGGSYLCVELLSRGHHVTGLARHPEKIGHHERYTPKVFDIETATFPATIEAMKGYDVVVNEFSPHSQGYEALSYMPFVEITRKIVRAVKIAQVPYFIMVGGAGSLEIPHIEPYLCAGESDHFWRAFRQAMADSESHVQYMEERLVQHGLALRKLRDARQRVFKGTASEADISFMKEYLEHAFHGDYSRNFVKAGRLTWMFFEDSTNWNWSYVSPPALYRPCGGGEKYHISTHLLPLDEKPRPQHYQGWYKDDPSDLEGRLRGISLIDFSRAVADDVEQRFGLHKHWTAFTALEDDTPYPSYVNLELGYRSRAEYERLQGSSVR